jgi:hypothetical protein
LAMSSAPQPGTGFFDQVTANATESPASRSKAGSEPVEPFVDPLQGKLALVDEACQRRLGGSEVCQSRGGQQALGEGADVDDPPVAVEPVQRLDRVAGEAELAVVVVLDDRRALPGGPGQQRQPPAKGFEPPTSGLEARRESSVRSPLVRRCCSQP